MLLAAWCLDLVWVQCQCVFLTGCRPFGDICASKCTKFLALSVKLPWRKFCILTIALFSPPRKGNVFSITHTKIVLNRTWSGLLNFSFYIKNDAFKVLYRIIIFEINIFISLFNISLFSFISFHTFSIHTIQMLGVGDYLMFFKKSLITHQGCIYSNDFEK